MSKQFSRAGALAAALLLTALAGCAAVKSAEAPAPVPHSLSVADADRKLALVAQQRAAAEAAFAASEQLCYARFLVNRCLDGAREKRRLTLAALRAIEIEAERFKRQARVDQRDRALASSEQEYKAREAQLAAEPPPAPRQEAAPAQPRAARNTQAEQAARVRKLDAQDQAGAAERAANVAAYEKRKRESEQRQRKIAEKMKARQAAGQ